MFATKESILIIYSVSGTSAQDIKSACSSVRSFSYKGSAVVSVCAEPVVFDIPSKASAGATLSSELTKHLNNSIGAIAFLDDMRSNIAYELGFFHGQGKSVLLISNGSIQTLWTTISDIAGSAILITKDTGLESGIHDYLNSLYDELSNSKIWPTFSLPSKDRNMLSSFAKVARVPVVLDKSKFGDSIQVDTWGGIIFDVGFSLLSNSRFKFAVRAVDYSSTFSIYFRVRYRSSKGLRHTIALGLTSNQSRLGFEANERNIPAQSLTSEFRIVTGSFQDLLSHGHIFDAIDIEHLEILRVRAGDYNSIAHKKNPAIELGYFEIMGINPAIKCSDILHAAAA